MAFLVRMFHYYLMDMLKAPAAEKLSLAGTIIQRIVQNIRRNFLTRFAGKVPVSDPILETQAALSIAERTYQPEPIYAPLTLFNSNLTWGTLDDDEMMGWSGYSTGGIRIYKFDAMRGTLLFDRSPATESLARRVRQLIDEQLSQRN